MAEGWVPVTTTPLTGTAVKIASKKAKVGPIVIGNLAAATTWVQLFDAAAAADVTPGTTKPKLTIAVAASVSKEADLCGLVFELGLVACSTTAAEGGTGASTNTMIGIG